MRLVLSAVFLLHFVKNSNVSAFVCPSDRNISVSGYYVLSSDAFQTSLRDVAQVCKIGLFSTSPGGLIVSVTHFFMFSHRQPKNNREIVVRSEQSSFVVKTESKARSLIDFMQNRFLFYSCSRCMVRIRMKFKAYKWFSGPVEVEMPMNLNFRAIVVITSVSNCSLPTSFPCSITPKVCVSREYLCDENDNCGEEVNCSETKRHLPLTSFEYDKDALSSSQLMLIGFFVVNLSFIVFFLTLSLCSAGYCFSKRLYWKQSQKSRKTFARFIRQAAEDSPPEKSNSPSLMLSPVLRKSSAPERRHRPSILSRLNFEPSPALQEQEPENEDRLAVSPMAELCSPPIHRPELFLRRQSMPALHRKWTKEKPSSSAWKRSSLGGRIV